VLRQGSQLNLPAGKKRPHLHRSRHNRYCPANQNAARARDVTHGKWITKKVGTDDIGVMSRMLDDVPTIAWIDFRQLHPDRP
jgi:hypothetical protein